MGNHVFICYAREDSEFVFKLAANLKARGVPIWLDQLNIPPKGDWDRAIDQAIASCADFLIVLSPTAVDSKEVRGELRVALDEDKLILPVLYRPCQIPRQLRRIQYVDFTSCGPDNTIALERVARALGAVGNSDREEPESRVEQSGQPAERTDPPDSLKARRAEEGKIRQPDSKAGQQALQSPKPPRTLTGLRMLVLIVVLGLLLVIARGLLSNKGAPPPTQTVEKPQQTQISPSVPTAPSPQKQEDRAGKPDMVTIPAGEFWMGCNEKVDQQCNEDEGSGKQVYLDAYAIDTNEVTVTEYRRCVETGTCSTTGLTQYASCNWDKRGHTDHPINCVDWQQAQMYCRWAGKRLPTEAEWERAARGTDGRKYPWDKEWDANKANVGGRGTVAVGSYPAGKSPDGLSDMAGNVGEWVQDWYAADYYDQGPARNPEGPANGRYKIVRGGSWVVNPRDVRVSLRFRYDPGSRNTYFGFRCAK